MSVAMEKDSRSSSITSVVSFKPLVLLLQCFAISSFETAFWTADGDGSGMPAAMSSDLFAERS